MNILRKKSCFVMKVLIFLLIVTPVMILDPLLSSAEENEKEASTSEENSSPVPIKILPKDTYGSVDWVKGAKEGHIVPLENLKDNPDPEMKPFGKPVIFKVKHKSVADVSFSHDVHTYWLVCSNCHPSLFPEKIGGTEGMSKSEISKGRFCGVCHGKVSFPLSECDRCHSKAK